MKSLQERFEAKYMPEPNSGCWLWAASTKHDGYGQFSVDGKMQRAHRVSWFLTHGEWPGGLHVCHKCDTPICVNPDHLFLGTKFDNMKDAATKNRIVLPHSNPEYKTHNQLKTHCLRGHALTGSNLIKTKDGRRNCRACMREHQRRYDRKRRAALQETTDGE